MANRLALRKKTKRGYEYVTHLGWLGMIRPTVSENFMSPMIEDSLLWEPKELEVERKGRTILSLIEEYLPGYELVTVSTSIKGSPFVLEQDAVIPSNPERLPKEKQAVKQKSVSNRSEPLVPVVVPEPEVEHQMFFELEEEPTIQLEPELEPLVELEEEVEELYEYEPELEPVADLEDELEYYGRINLFDAEYASY